MAEKPGVSPEGSSHEDPPAEPDADAVKRAEEVAVQAEARYRKRWSDAFGRLRKEFPDLPETVKDERSLAEHLKQRLAKPTPEEPEPESDDEHPEEPSRKPRTIGFDRHKAELARARKEAASEASGPLKTELDKLRAETAELHKKLRRGVVYSEVRRLCEDPEVDLVPDGVLRYLDAPDADDPFELRPGEKPGSLLVWNRKDDEEATDAKGQRLDAIAYLAGLTKRSGLEYLKRTRLSGGTGGGNGASAATNPSAAVPKKRTNDPWEMEPEEAVARGWAEDDARKQRARA